MEKDNPKQPYEKPVLRSIELHVEEIMGNCKITAVSPGPVSLPRACIKCSAKFGGS